MMLARDSWTTRRGSIREWTKSSMGSIISMATVLSPTWTVIKSICPIEACRMMVKARYQRKGNTAAEPVSTLVSREAIPFYVGH